MARYGKIETGFWHSRKIRRLSQEAKFLMLYLLSCPHGNAIGCFVLHDGYISTDLGWSPDTVETRMAELIENALVERDGDTSLLRVLGWWGHNNIENVNVAKHAAKEITALPACKVKDNLTETVLALTRLHPMVMQTLTERLGKPFQNTSVTVAEPYRNQEPSPTLPDTTQSVAPAVVGAQADEDAKPKKRGTRIDANWRPNDDDRQFASSLGFADAETDAIYPGFVDYWIAKAGPNGVKVDWSATWRNWMRKEAQGGRRKPVASSHAAAVSIDWERAVAGYRESKGSRWAHRQLGPEPGYSGCRAPHHVLVKHGFGPSEAPQATIAGH